MTLIPSDVKQTEYIRLEATLRMPIMKRILMYTFISVIINVYKRIHKYTSYVYVFVKPP